TARPRLGSLRARPPPPGGGPRTFDGTDPMPRPTRGLRTSSPLRPLRRAQGMALVGLALSLGFNLRAAEPVPDPSAHLGFRPGADFRLAGWEAVVSYFEKVDRA